MMKRGLFAALTVLAALPAVCVGSLTTREYDLLDGYCGLRNQLLLGARPWGRRQDVGGPERRFRLTDRTEYVINGKKSGLDRLEEFCSEQNRAVSAGRGGGFAERFIVRLTHAPPESGREAIEAVKVEIVRRGEAEGWTLKEFQAALAQLRELHAEKKDNEAFRVGLVIFRNGEFRRNPPIEDIVKDVRGIMDAMRGGPQ